MKSAKCGSTRAKISIQNAVTYICALLKIIQYTNWINFALVQQIKQYANFYKKKKRGHIECKKLRNISKQCKDCSSNQVTYLPVYRIIQIFKNLKSNYATKWFLNSISRNKNTFHYMKSTMKLLCLENMTTTWPLCQRTQKDINFWCMFAPNYLATISKYINKMKLISCYSKERNKRWWSCSLMG